MTINPNTVLYAATVAGKGGVRFVVLWIMIAFWTFVMTACVAAYVSTLIPNADGDASAATFFIMLGWLIVYLNALCVALWCKMR